MKFDYPSFAWNRLKAFVGSLRDKEVGERKNSYFNLHLIFLKHMTSEEICISLLVCCKSIKQFQKFDYSLYLKPTICTNLTEL